jgi:uncharacterized membrane protein YdjX (TVP38/TMEM64 family)
MATQSPSSIPWLKLFILLIFVGGFVAFFTLKGDQYFSFTTLKAKRDLLLHYAQNHFNTMLIGAVVIYTASTALSLPMATVLSLMIGFLFGRWIGTAIVLFSATLGATLVFLAARYIFGEFAQRRMGHLAKKAIAGFHENDFNYLLFLRLVPLFPFWLVNLAPAFTPIRVHTYIVATAIGIMPATFVFANLGQSLGHIHSPDQLLSLETVSALALLGVIALVPVLVKKYRSKKLP